MEEIVSLTTVIKALANACLSTFKSNMVEVVEAPPSHPLYSVRLIQTPPPLRKWTVVVCGGRA